MNVPGASCSSTAEIAEPYIEIALSLVHFQTCFQTCKVIAVADRECAAVQQKLGTMPATKRKFQAMEPDPEAAPATIEGEKCFLVQGDALSDTLSKTTRPCCLAMD